ncbi:MAG TPA: ferritin-like domain-containing protein [Longimicrobium sp.]|nr:ferritin-like domain-containing protein [Longimicrobium sp.]
MAKFEPARDGEPMVIARAGELMGPTTRRSFVRTLLAGGSVMLLPSVFTACDNDDGGNPLGPGEIPDPVTGISFDLRSDVGIFRFVHLNEQLEAAFYTAVVASGTYRRMNADERELLRDLRDVEVVHREFVRTALGSQALPDIRGSIDLNRLENVLSSRESILTLARAFENNGVAALNGSGKYLTDPRNLLLAGKFASVEARHAAALEDVLPPPGVNANTAFAGDHLVDGTGRDVKLEAGVALQNALATGLLMPSTLANPPIAAAPTPAQGVPTADFFPANP